MARSRRAERDARYTIRMYEDIMLEDEMELDDPLVRTPTQQELKITERVAPCNAGNMD